MRCDTLCCIYLFITPNQNIITTLALSEVGNHKNFIEAIILVCLSYLAISVVVSCLNKLIMAKQLTNGDDPINVGDHVLGQYGIGLSKREYFAGLAMQGILSSMTYDPATNISKQGISIQATDRADALINYLNQ